MVGSYRTPKSNLTATSAPTVSDDITSGFSGGSVWIDTVAVRCYVCLDPSSGAAVWIVFAPTIHRIVTITSDITLNGLHHAVFCDTTLEPITVTLPAAADHPGQPYEITNIGTTNKTVTVIGPINGDTQILVPLASMPVLSDGVQWRISG